MSSPSQVPPPVAELRRTYRRGELLEGDLAAHPIEQFARWLADAVAAGLPEPNAMVLATADADGQPSTRTVLLKGYDERGFTFYTNLGSRKSRELAVNPRASLCFPWHPMERQVIVVGAVEPVARDEAAAYFASRPHGSRLGAWASRQSSVLASRDELEERYAELLARYPDSSPASGPDSSPAGGPASGPDSGPDSGEVPLPDFWGGWRVVPATVEFWAGRPSRLHDRLRYRREPDGWAIERLSP